MIDSLKSIKTRYEKKIKEFDILIKHIEEEKFLAEFERFESIFYIVQTQAPMKIRDKDDSSGKIIFRPKAGETIKLIDFNDLTKCWFVTYNNTGGYVNEVFIKNSQAIRDFKKYLVVKKAQIEAQKIEDKRILEAREAEERRKAEDQLARERAGFARQYSEQMKRELIIKYGNDIGTKLAEQKIWVGMTDEMVKDTWGVPDRNIRNIGNFGTHEQWVYDILHTHLIFVNGVLTTWREF